MTTLKNALLSLVAVVAFATPVFAADEAAVTDTAAAVEATADAELAEVHAEVHAEEAK